MLKQIIFSIVIIFYSGYLFSGVGKCTVIFETAKDTQRKDFNTTAQECNEIEKKPEFNDKKIAFVNFK